MDWWLWLLLGLALLGVEMLTPSGFYVLFFGVGALTVGALTAAGIGGPVSVQWLLFSAVSIAGVTLVRRRLLPSTTAAGDRAVDSFGQDVAILLEDLPVGGVGKAELRGTTWTVRNAGAGALRAGQRCRVERIDGLTLWLRAE
jgi:inner membrane protein